MEGTKPGASKTRHHRENASFLKINAALARKIRALRSAKGWTIEHAAERVQVEPSHLKRLEAGTANPTLALLVSLSRAFGMRLGELIEDPAPGGK